MPVDFRSFFLLLVLGIGDILISLDGLAIADGPFFWAIFGGALGGETWATLGLWGLKRLHDARHVLVGC